MSRCAILTALVCLLLGAGRAAAEGVAVFPVQGANLDQKSLEAAGLVLAHTYAKVSEEKVIGPTETGPVLAEAGGPMEAAAKLGVEEYLLFQMVRLEQKLIVTGTRLAADGTVLFTDQMTALSLDDLEQVAVRLARALHGRLAAGETGDWQTVTAAEAQPANKLFPEKLVGFKLAGIYGASYGPVEDLGLVSAQFDLRLEAKTFFLEFGVGLKLPSQTDHPLNGSLFAEVGASYYLTPFEHTPYLGAGLIGRIDFEGDSPANMAPYLQFGWMFFRSSSTRLFVDLRASHDLFLHRENDWDDGKVRYRMTEVALLMGVGF